MTKGFRGAACALLGAAWVLAAGWPAVAEPGSIPAANPESVGLSTERLQRVHAAMQAQIEAGNQRVSIFLIQGGQAAIARTAFENAVRQSIVN